MKNGSQDEHHLHHQTVEPVHLRSSPLEEDEDSGSNEREKLSLSLSEDMLCPYSYCVQHHVENRWRNKLMNLHLNSHSESQLIAPAEKRAKTDQETADSLRSRLI